MGFATKLLTAVILAFIAFGITTSIAESDVDPAVLLETVKADPAGAGSAGVCYGLAYNSVTGAYQKDWLPPEGKLIFMLEDFPYPDTTDFIILGVIALLTVFVLKQSLYRNGWNPLLQFLAAAGIMLLVLLFSWVVLKIVAYNMMFICGERIGLTAEGIQAGRTATIAHAEAAGIVVPSLLLTAFTGIAVLFGMTGGKKE